MRTIYEYDEAGRYLGAPRDIQDDQGRPAASTLVEPPAGQGPWYWSGGAWVSDPVRPVPDEVTMRQAKLQLSRAGLLATADAAIDALEGQRGEEARIEWRDARTLRRDHPLVAGIGAALGLDDEAKDDLFRAAALIP